MSINSERLPLLVKLILHVYRVKFGKANMGKVQMSWKWSFGLLESAQTAGNQMGATHPLIPFKFSNLAFIVLKYSMDTAA